MATNQKIQLLNFMVKRKKCDKEALGIVMKLVETDVTKEYLLEKTKNISPHHLDDVAEERSIAGICGWSLCDKSLINIPRQQFIIRGKKVMDITERKKFCSSACYTTWTHFKANMMTSPLWLRDEEPTPTFTIYEPESKEDLLEGVLVKLQNVSLDDAKDESDDDEND